MKKNSYKDLYKDLSTKEFTLISNVEEMLDMLHIAMFTGNKTVMKKFRKLSNEITKELKEFRQQSINIEKGAQNETRNTNTFS